MTGAVDGNDVRFSFDTEFRDTPATRVVHHDPDRRRRPERGRITHDRATGAPSERVGHERVTGEAVAANRDEQVASTE